MKEEARKTPPLLPVLATLRTGLELTTKNIWLVLIPALLDSFYWLGPRLSLEPVIQSIASLLQRQVTPAGVDASGITALTETWLNMAPQTNLFTQLRLPIIGVPALMAGLAPAKTPIAPAVLAIDNVGLLAAAFLLLSTAGLTVSVVYYGLVAVTVRDGRVRLPDYLRQLPRMLLRSAGLVLLVVLGAVLVFLPFYCLSALTILFSPGLTVLVWFLGSMPVVALIMYGLFSPHGILLAGRPILTAYRQSMQLVRQHLMSIVALFLLIFLLGSGMNLLWRIADDGSWLTLISILGHGFISTSLAAATFVFFQDRLPTLRALPPTTLQSTRFENE